MVREELPLRELLMMLLGEEGRRKLENQPKLNDQLFHDYYDFINTTVESIFIISIQANVRAEFQNVF